MSSGSTPAKTAKSSGRTLAGIGPGGQMAPSSPTSRAMIAAVAGASPVTITVRTPSVVQLLDELGRIGARRIAQRDDSRELQRRRRPRPRREPESPSLRVPAPSRRPSATGSASLTTTAKAPFTARSAPPFASTAVASLIFVAGSNGTNLVSFGGSAMALLRGRPRGWRRPRDPARRRSWREPPSPGGAPHRSQPRGGRR